MKSFTDVQQSQALAEILPIESADCCYIKYCTSDNIEWRYEGQPPMFLGDGIPITEITAEHIPCWSLAALLDVLPKYIGDYGKCLYYDMGYYYCGYMVDGDFMLTIKETKADNPIDACVEMILKLNKDGLL